MEQNYVEWKVKPHGHDFASESGMTGGTRRGHLRTVAAPRLEVYPRVPARWAELKLGKSSHARLTTRANYFKLQVGFDGDGTRS